MPDQNSTSARASAPEILPLGLNSFVVRFATHGSPGESGAVQAFADAATAAEIPGVIELARALASVRVSFDPAHTTAEAISATLRALLDSRDWQAMAPPAPKRRWTIPVAVGPAFAPQLGEVAQLAGRTETETLAELTTAELTVLAIGFAPGQPYIGPMPDNWNFARQTALTPQVPAGALTAAVRQLVLFANPSPTGWRQIGQCAFRPFQADRNRPFLLEGGDAIRFVIASDAEMQDLMLSNDQGLGGARCETEE